MTRTVRWAALAAGVLVGLAPAGAAWAQGANPGYFIPPQGGGGAAPQQSRPPVATRPNSPPPRPPSTIVQPPAPSQQEPEPPPIQVQLPPVPDLPALPRSSGPPAAVIGVLGIPDIMRASTAAQQIEKTVGERREKLNEDAQKEQAAWRDLQQSLTSQRANLSADQIRTRERELQDRITNAQKQFRDRNRIIQEAGQYGLAQIERMLIAVIRQVAESRGMNLVLHRAQVALNVNEFDVTEPVVEQLNKMLPVVQLPPEGVSPANFTPVATPVPPAATPAAVPAPAPAPAPAATPAPARPATPAAPAAPAPAPAAPRR